MMPSLRHLLLLAGVQFASTAIAAIDVSGLEAGFNGPVRATLKQYCLDCHSTEKRKGELDLERFTSVTNILKHPTVWQSVAEQLADRQMPPEDKPQPPDDERAQLLAWVNGVLDAAAAARAGDPGPVVLRRLNNAEYTYTIRDLTGVASLDPAQEFPTDSAAGEGFMNVGQALVMSPALVTKYLDAAKEVANHAVLLPDGIRFSPHTTRRDWTEELLAEIRDVYRQYTDNGGGTSVNLQGIRFDTKDGGVLPLDKYLAATLHIRELVGPSREAAANEGPKNAESRRTNLPLPGGEGEKPVRTPDDLIPAVAHERGLSPRYLATLWNNLAATNAHFLLTPIRARWREAKPADAPALAQEISQWQHALWKFNSVGHIGKRDGPRSWMEPLTPMQDRQELRLKLPAATGGPEVTLYLSAADAGDGDAGDFVVWQEPRLVQPGQPPLLLREVRDVHQTLAARRERTLTNTASYLAAAARAAAARAAAGETNLATLASAPGVEADTLAAWLDYLGLNASGPVKLEGHFTEQFSNGNGYAFIAGWGSGGTPNLTANSSDQHVRIPGNMKPHSIAVHPSPQLAAAVGWRSPVAGRMRVVAAIQHAHPECGNGVTWSLELRRGSHRQRLANGVAQGGNPVNPAPIESLAVQPGDVVSLLIGPRNANHSCDLTAVDLTLTTLGDGPREWDLAKDVSPDVHAGNPHADRFGNEGVWHFYTEPDQGAPLGPVIPADSLLAKWQAAEDAAERTRLATQIEGLLRAPAPPPADSPDGALHRQLTSLSGPLFGHLDRSRRAEAPTRAGTDGSPVPSTPASAFGLSPAQFTGSDLAVRAPSVIEIRLPADLVAGYEFVTTGRLDPDRGAEGSVQLQVHTNRPTAGTGLIAIEAKTSDGEGPWYSNNRTTSHTSPVVTRPGSAARRRIEADFESFRQLFPAALCYTKIVPVDEVVTLTLLYREDDQFKRLMLDEAQAARLDRLWDELRYVAEDDLRMVDVFEQLWQYATQDADPSVFEPMREPIQRRAAAFRQRLVATEPAHVEAVLQFAEGAYRRTLTTAEQAELRALYQRLRTEEIAHDDAIRLTLARTLVAPAFLYKLETPPPGDQPGPVTDAELATRLSYFLWSAAPDAELRAVATAGRLRDPEVLVAQTRRMLQDERTRRLATEFACAWLHIYDFDELGEKSERHFPTFAGLRGAMYEETIRFFTDLFQHNGSVLNILDADYTFLNADLAEHYGIELRTRNAEHGTGSDGWRRVDGVKQFGRGGILAQATTLAKQSGASRTSPILRGNWLAEVILGEKLPRPPPNVPQLPEDEATETLTVRELTEKHSSDPRCFGCHRRIDPYGFSLEAYDAIGRLRDKDLGGRPIDVKTKVMDGTEIDGLAGLRDYLLHQRRDAFLKQFCRKLLGYSLGRGVLLSDGPLINEMRAQLKQNDFRVSAALEAIVRSKQFREIRGREMARED